MKTTHKNLTISDYTAKSSHVSLKRIKGFLRLNTTLNYPTEGFKSSIKGFSETKENEALRTEAEIRRNQSRIYESIIPPK
jgi:hypothetical protein